MRCKLKPIGAEGYAAATMNPPDSSTEVTDD